MRYAVGVCQTVHDEALIRELIVGLRVAFAAEERG
jgi:hypothetical protein